jgi:hypothetical protein
MPLGSNRLRRLLDIRRIGLRGRVAALVIVGVGIIGLLLLPKLVRGQVAARLQARTGLPVQVGSVSLGLFSLVVEDVSVGVASGPFARASHIELDASPLLLALRGARALDGVRVQQLHVRVPLQAAASRALIERLLARPRGEPEKKASSLPAIHVERFAMELSDALSEIVRVSGARITADAQGAQVDVERLRIGQSPASVLELEHVALGAKRAPQGLRIQRMTVAQARMRLAEPAKAAEAAPDEDEPDDVDPAAAPPKRAASSPAKERSTWRRMLAVLQIARGPAAARGSALAQTKDASASAKGAPTNAEPALVSRLADDAVLTLAKASIAVGPNGPELLQGLHGTLKMQPGRALALVASGKAQGEGVISCDLVVRPALLRADGQVQLRSLPLSLLAPFLPDAPWYEPENGRIDAELVIKTEPAQGIAFSGEARLRDAAISSPRIAPTPVRGVDVALHGRGRFLPLQHRLEVAQAELALTGASLEVTGAVEWSADHYLFDIDATLPKTACTKAVHSIPEDLLGDMAVASWQGKIGGHLRLKLDSRQLDDTELVVAPEDHCEFTTVPAIADLRRFRMPFIHSVLEPDGTLFEMETGPGTAAWTFLEDISPFFVHAVLAHEDAGFFSHHGFSPHHIRDALVKNLKEGRYVVGASTITMQLVKNVFLHREKTLARKIQEVLLTWWIERVMEKRDILELYLNVIEYGPSVYGIRNAAKHYFNRLPSQLSPAESVYLATILPNPKRYHLAFERGALSAGWIDQMRKMLIRMRARDWYTPEAVDYGFKELESFHFAPEGTIVPSRQIPGGTAALPYMQAFAQQPGWGDDSEPGTPQLAPHAGVAPPSPAAKQESAPHR